MTKETAQTNVGCYFWAFNRRCKVLQVKAMGAGNVIHYGFRTVDDSSSVVGWIPVELVGQCEFSK
jgi:hypothetical protein